MAFWNRLVTGEKEKSPGISFGRFSDAYKSPEQLAFWDKSLQDYEKGDYTGSIRSLVRYLTNPGQTNLLTRLDGPQMEFSLYQGSKQIDCTITQHLFRAECKIAHCKELNVGFLRKAVEYNYDLNYARFALDAQNNLCMVFDSLLSESSPYKLYYGLKELAVQSDKEDDLMLHEFEYLEPLGNQHVRKLEETLIHTKMEFVREKLSSLHATDLLGSLNPKRYQGALTYAYLSVFYSIDYLVKPEGLLMDKLGKIHLQYFSLAPERLEDKIFVLQNGLKELEAMSDADLYKEMYEVVSTFGITSPANHSVVAQFIESELQTYKWYEENKHDKVCLAICNYIAGYCMYNFALPGPDHDLMHLYFEIVEQDYFQKLGFNVNYFSKDRTKLSKSRINQRIEEILSLHKKNFPDLPTASSIEDEELTSVLKSLLWFIKNLPLK